MKFFAALKSAEFATKAFAAAGFDFEAALKAGDVNALKVFIDGKVSAAAAAVKPDEALTAKVTTLEAALESATTENTNLTGSNSVLVGALTAVGFKFPATSSSKPEAEQIAAHKAALEDHIKIRAQGILAISGHKAIADLPGGSDAAAANLTGAARTRAAFERQQKK